MTPSLSEVNKVLEAGLTSSFLVTFPSSIFHVLNSSSFMKLFQVVSEGTGVESVFRGSQRSTKPGSLKIMVRFDAQFGAGWCRGEVLTLVNLASLASPSLWGPNIKDLVLVDQRPT